MDLGSRLTRIFDIEHLRLNDGSPIEDIDLKPVQWEENYARGERSYRQLSWIFLRTLTLEAAKKIVDDTFCAKGFGGEFGSGAFGWFNNHLLPKETELVQFDINRLAVKSNLRYSRFLGKNPAVAVGSTYSMPVKESSLDFVVGFNSWDCLYFLERSVGEVWRSLRPGGLFLHYQDIGPATNPLLIMESKKRSKTGLNKEVKYDVTKDERNMFFIPGQPSFIDSVELDRMVSFGEYLNNELRNVFQKLGFNIELCAETKREVIKPRDKMIRILRKIGFRENNSDLNRILDGYDLRGNLQSLNSFETFQGNLRGRYDPALVGASFDGKDLVRQKASMYVLIAQKPQ